MLAATLDRLDREASGRLLAGVRCAEICERAGRVYWLNPEPRRFWNEGDSVIGRYAPLCAQVRECRTLRQIADFVESLTVGSAASLPAHQLAS